MAARRVGIVPAAGVAARLQPLVGSKEMCVVGDRPVIDCVLDRLAEAACDELVVVTRPEKTDVAEHARLRGARVVTGEPATVGGSIALGLEAAAPAGVVLLGFPDTIWEPATGFSSLVDALRPGVDVALGLFEAPEPARSDVVVLEDAGVRRVLVKPEDPPSALIWGCLAARPAALAGIDRHDEPGHLLDALARSGRVAGVFLSSDWTDIGTPGALAEARARAAA